MNFYTMLREQRMTMEIVIYSKTRETCEQMLFTNKEKEMK